MVPAWVNVKMLRKAGRNIQGYAPIFIWLHVGRARLTQARPKRHFQMCLFWGFAGCQLPVEMLFPAAEYPTAEVVAVLADMGVTCRSLPDVVVQSSKKTKLPGSGGEATDPMSGFTLKIAAVILSRFQEVAHWIITLIIVAFCMPAQPIIIELFKYPPSFVYQRCEFGGIKELHAKCR